jgi:hypothetical protein
VTVTVISPVESGSFQPLGENWRTYPSFCWVAVRLGLRKLPPGSSFSLNDRIKRLKDGTDAAQMTR